MTEQVGDMAKLQKIRAEIDDFRNDSAPESLTWQHSATGIALVCVWMIADFLHDLYNEAVEANNKF